MGIIYAILVGIASGWLGSKLFKTSFGLLGYLIVGLVGGLIGGFVFGLLGLSINGVIGNIVSGGVGAFLLLYVLSLVKK